MFTADEKRREAIEAPVGGAILTRGTHVVSRPGWYQVIAPGAAGFRNEIVLSTLDAARADAEIDAVIAAHRAAETPFKWIVGPWTEPADMDERLAARGLTSSDMRGMVIETERTRRPLPAGVTIEEVEDRNVADYRRVSVEAWAAEQLAPQASIERQLAQSEEDTAWMRAQGGRYRLFLARADGVPAGTAGLIVKERSVYLVGAVVRAEARGRGVYRALVEARLAAAAALGRELATTQAREATSAPRLERMGFETVFRARVRLWTPQTTSSP